MAEIKFYANINADNSNRLIAHEAGSGLGFYGSDYGVSVPIGSRQDSTWITNSTGTEATHQLKLHNSKFVTAGAAGGDVGKVSANGSEYDLDKLPNYLTPLNIRFTHTEEVRVQNCKLRIFDRNDVSNHASGVITYVFEARHPSDYSTQTNLEHRGVTDGDYWTEFDSADSASPADMVFTSSPGISGHSSSNADAEFSSRWNEPSDMPSPLEGALHSSTQHDWYTAVSAEPVTIGSKTDFGLYFTLEYL
jgi:hypothetical protein